MSAVALRPAGRGDEELLLAIYASTRTEEIAMVPWDEAQKQAFLSMQYNAQRSHYAAHYPASIQQIVLVDDQPIGRLWLEEQADRIHVLDLTLLPVHRSRGTGSALLRRLMAQAAAGGKALTIYVENFNPSIRLFEWLGFSPVEEVGVHVLYRWAMAE